MAVEAECVVVLGATGSVGDAVCGLLAERGARTFVAGRNAEKLESTAAKYEAAGSAIVDAVDSETVTACFQHATGTMPRITGVVNCIGSILLKPAHLVTDDELSEILQVNLVTSFAVLREASKAMRSHGGSVVFCSTAAAQVGLANHEAIAAAKGGIDALVRSAAATYGPRGLRVNAVAPGLVKSEMTRKIWENDASASASQDMHVLGRLGEPKDIANAIGFLVNPDSSWITGQVLGVDGGLGGIVPRQKQRSG